jgi:CxxC-x17-CxxC domain-containing protein
MTAAPQPDDAQTSCADCGVAYAVTAVERGYYRERGLPAPARCPDCRAARRAARNADFLAAYAGVGAVEARALHGGYGGTSPSGNGRPGRRGGALGPRVLHRATCAACGVSTEVPFAPRGDRPVYCGACFNARRGR